MSVLSRTDRVGRMGSKDVSGGVESGVGAARMQVLVAASDSGGLAVLDRLHSSYAILLTLVGIAVLAAVLFKIGVIGFLLRVFGAVVRRGVWAGFRVWEVLF